jgi:carbon starvation protein CstA
VYDLNTIYFPRLSDDLLSFKEEMMPERYPYSATPESVALTKYVGRFVTTYLILAVLIGLATALFKLENISALSVVVVLASAQLAGYVFFKDVAREPSVAEKRRFALYGMGFSVLAAVLPFSYLILAQEPETMDLLATLGKAGFGVALLIAAGLTYFLSALGFTQGAKIYGKIHQHRRK